MKGENIEKSFREVYDLHGEAIFRFVYFKIGDRERAREIMQEAFMKTWEMLSRGKEIDNLKAYVYRAAQNLSINELERRKQNFSLEIMQEETGFDPVDDEALPDELSEAKIVAESIKLLEDNDREILVMRYLNDQSIKEIADILDQSENTISVRLHRALKKLKELHK